ncbi:MAG: hypothetical protein ACR2MN_07110 [Acidimicrobiales bacterium]
MLSPAGAAIGVTVGALSVPLNVAVTARPRLSRSNTTVPARAASTEFSVGHRVAAVVVPVVACAVTGARVGPGWVLPGFLAAAIGLVDARWRLLPKRVVYPTWAAGLAGDAPVW